MGTAVVKAHYGKSFVVKQVNKGKSYHFGEELMEATVLCLQKNNFEYLQLL